MSVIDATALAIVALSAIAIAVALAASVLAADAFAAALSPPTLSPLRSRCPFSGRRRPYGELNKIALNTKRSHMSECLLTRVLKVRDGLANPARCA